MIYVQLIGDLVGILIGVIASVTSIIVAIQGDTTHALLYFIVAVLMLKPTGAHT